MTREQEADIQWRLLNFYDEGEAQLWLESPQKLLNGRRAKDCSYEEVSRLIAQLEDGVYI